MKQQRCALPQDAAVTEADQVFHIGPASVAVPGMLAGLVFTAAYMLRVFGKAVG